MVAVPPTSFDAPMMLPLLAWENVTERRGAPREQETWALTVTHESWLTEVADGVSVILLIRAAGAEATPAGTTRLTAVTMPKPASVRWHKRISTLLRLDDPPTPSKTAATLPPIARLVNRYRHSRCRRGLAQGH